ncbi:MAG: hypothetical protein QGG24_04915, partial [Vicinamibacterales bacterium]|nr:hypothetical protein [Vicinamibacterales bacterium]
MRLPFELYVALRYLLARRRQAFISLISVISTIGVAVGVMALLIALALMTGLQQELRDRIVGSTAHVYVWKLGEAGLVVDPREARTLPLGRWFHAEHVCAERLGEIFLGVRRGIRTKEPRIEVA